MMIKSNNVFLHISYKKVLALSLLAVIFGIGFAGFLMPTIIRQAMRMASFSDFNHFHESCKLLFNLIAATTCNTWNDDSFNVCKSPISDQFSNLHIEHNESGRSNSRRKAEIRRAWSILF